jgi:hypothetical protein
MGLSSLLGFVSQRSLKSCRLELEDRSLERASLFPMFDQEGRTRMLMITAEDDGRILLADWASGLFARNWSRRHRVHLRFADLRDASSWNEERFADLWHFDPWWVLGEERYHGHGSVPALRNTNIPGYEPTISGMRFDATLGRAVLVSKQTGDNHTVWRFTADTLAGAAKRRRAVHEGHRRAPDGWQLRPFWRFSSRPHDCTFTT